MPPHVPPAVAASRSDGQEPTHRGAGPALVGETRAETAADRRSRRRAQQEQQRAAKTAAGLSPAATTFLVVRHGETAWNAEHRLQGQRDPPLNELGARQAAALAARLAREVPCDAVCSSDLARAAATAATIAEAYSSAGSDVGPVAASPAFRERSLGVLEGLTAAEARQQQPEAWALMTGGSSEARIPGGESAADVEARAADGVDALARDHPGQTLVLVTHGGILQVLYRHATGREFGGRFRNAALNTLWVDRGRWRVGVWNDDAHLEGIGVQKEAFGGGLGG